MPEDLESLGRALQALHDNCIDARESLQAQIGWKEDDARLTVFNKCSNVVASTTLGVLFMFHHLRKADWWKTFLPSVQWNDAQHSCDEFNMFLRISFVQGYFYAVESSMRAWVRAIDPVACSGGQAEFKSIYDWLLNRLSLARHQALMDLLRLIRNVMHNNGLFMPKTMKDGSVSHAGTTYDFHVGKPTPFVTWPFNDPDLRNTHIRSR